MTSIAAIAAVLLTWLSVVPPPQADAVLAGRVVTADSARAPVRRAIVTLTGGDLPTNVSAITDEDGRFMLTRLRAGRYTVTASKVAHLTVAYGATRPGRPGTPIVLADGQQRIDLTIALPRGAVISGMVRDFVGEPATNISVTIASADVAGRLGAATQLGSRGGGTSAFVDGRLVFTQTTPAAGARATTVMTDDRGVYRAYGLAPGEYTVSAAPNSSDVSLALQNRRTLAGALQISRAEMDEGLTALQQRAASTAPRSPVRSPIVSDMPALTYAPIFYPGTPLADEAERIRVEAGEERTGVDFRMDLVRTARLEGVMTSADGGALPPHQLSISAVDSPFLSTPPQRFTSTLASNAAFRYDALPPGRYVLFARGVPPTTPQALATQTTFPITPPPSTHWAMADVLVKGADVLGVVLSLRPTMALSGRVAFEATTLAPPADLAHVRVGLVRAAPRPDETVAAALASRITPPISGPIGADGTFGVSGIMPGSYGISASVTGATGSAGWWLKSVIVAGRDVLDHPLEFGTGGDDVIDAVLTFSDRHSELAGRLQTPAGDPATEYVVVVFPADRALWRAGSRRFRFTRPASDGRFALQDLPAGAYMIAALTDVDPNDWQAPAFLEDLIPAAVKVLVADGAKVQQDLRIVR